MPTAPPKNPAREQHKSNNQKQNVSKSVSGPGSLCLEIHFVLLLLARRGWLRRLLRFGLSLQSILLSRVSQQIIIGEINFLQLFLGLGTETFVMAESIRMPDIDQIA